MLAKLALWLADMLQRMTVHRDYYGPPAELAQSLIRYHDRAMGWDSENYPVIWHDGRDTDNRVC